LKIGRLLSSILFITSVLFVSTGTTADRNEDIKTEFPALDVLKNLGQSDEGLSLAIGSIMVSTGSLLGSGRAPQAEKMIQSALAAIPVKDEVPEDRYPTFQAVKWLLKILLSRTLDGQRKTKEGMAILENVLDYEDDKVKKRIILADKDVAQVIRMARMYLIIDLVALGYFSRVEREINVQLDFVTKIYGLNSNEYLLSLEQKAGWLDSQTRHKEAEKLWRQILNKKTLIFGPASNEAGETLGAIGENLSEQSRHVEATTFLKRSLSILERYHMPYDVSLQLVLINLAHNLFERGLYSEAKQIYERVKTKNKIKRQNEDVTYKLSQSFRSGLIKIEEITGVPFVSDIFESRRFANSKKEAEMKSSVSTVLLANNFPKMALDLNRESVAFYKNRVILVDQTVMMKRRRITDGREIFLKQLKILSAVLKVEETGRAGYYEEGFETTQLTRSISSAQAIIKMAARVASGQGKLATQVRAMQDAEKAWRSHDDKLLQMINAPPNTESIEKEKRLRSQMGVLEERIKFLSNKVFADFPAYAALTSREPMPLKSTQALLSPDEALVNYALGSDWSYIWAVGKESVGFERVEVKRSDLEAAVAALRGSLDPEGVQGLGDVPAFDTTKAYELYEKLFAPIEKHLEGIRHVMVVPDGALQSLPLGVLVTEKPQGSFTDFSGYRQVPWLAKKYALSTLPSVGSLKALRMFAKKAVSEEPFKGFGDPVLDGGSESRGSVQMASLFRGGPIVDGKALRKLGRLSDTADELKAIAKTLGADEGSVFLGERATESRVKDMDLSGTRVISFATHGLVSGQLRGVQEPGLVLTPPDTGTEKDDGYLTASEVAQLKLNADWVILSACNTASSDGTPGAEGLSGLAKAFFYAGSRALLVSHWPVLSSAAAKLTTRMLKEAKAKGVGRAEALKRSMLALMNTPKQPHLAHPMFWAPFSVVGEGGG
jgi:CHAT domain-containing protein/tetratricopeptide (TPR) repeat protein